MGELTDVSGLNVVMRNPLFRAAGATAGTFVVLGGVTMGVSTVTMGIVRAVIKHQKVTHQGIADDAFFRNTIVDHNVWCSLAEEGGSAVQVLQRTKVSAMHSLQRHACAVLSPHAACSGNPA